MPDLTKDQIIQLDRRNKENMEDLKAEIFDLGEQVGELKRTLRGSNGDVGFIERVSRQELTLCTISNDVKEIKLLLIGDQSNPESRGMRGKQHDLDVMHQAVKRFFWIVIGAVVSATIGIITVLLTS